ncbi:uncharacterized protein EV422DRAFT_318113 [Fimicolochytrium jonesii]|uniref:uncharacterized protein n=1 Tax=Fimicolochytrium jonesii TaxID=1396493 RepID=UPI0022FE5306|nr:uncharacterized protein EV422DRAFT_318113 [Fimicolochytrium jonesii]KAI8824368.1 hypothetical protein EV422DRAFT_318113 [Fimicolochytrium jonesii]
MSFDFEGAVAPALNATSGVPPPYMPNYLERKWLETFDNTEYAGMKLALALLLWHEFVFFGRFLPYYIMDQIPYFQKYKIQDAKPNTPEMYRKCVISVIKSQLFVQGPLLLLFHRSATWLGMKFLEVPFPSWTTIALSCLFCLVMEDTYHYFVHRLGHHPALYKHVHKVHHEFSAPFGIAAEHAHPIEVLVLGQGFFIGPVLLLLMGVDMHVITMFAWLALRLVETVDVHAGYDFPWSFHKFIPFWGGAEFHDYHHMAFVGNYSSSFRYWDWLFGTDQAFETWKAKQANKKVAAGETPRAGVPVTKED